jgi:hypothetical protein
MDVQRVLREGFIAGMIGAGAIAVWFLVVDTVSGHPFFTPSMLGSALFWREMDMANMQVVFARVVAYTMVHVLAFMLVGTIAAALALAVERAPATFFLVIVFFAVFEFGFYVVVAVLAQPILGALAWWNVAIGNALAGLGMGVYLWRMHPKLKAELAAHPLGDPT